MGETINIGVLGAAGRMGRMLVTAIGADDACRLSGAAEGPGAETLGQDAGILAGLAAAGVAITDDAGAVISSADVVIDFTVPAATVANAGLAADAGTAFVAGTTGLNEADHEALRTAAEKVALLWAPNMSPAVNLLFGLTRIAARALADYDAEIVEMHHRHKVDAPSGTALALGRAVAAGRGVDLDAVQKLAREGMVGERPAGEIGFATLRGGDVAGEHSVVLAGAGERIELTHRASDRMIFARGAVAAANWIADKPAGLYTMADMLGLEV